MSHVPLAGTDDYLITFHRATRRSGEDSPVPLVITFGGQPSGLGSSGFGTGWALQFGWDTIYVAQRAGTQYQKLSIEAFSDAVSPITAGRDVVCYGSSLGGYAALYYAGAINARVLAAAPILPAWPPLGRPHDAIPILHEPLTDVKRTSHSPVVVFDPMVTADRLMIEKLVRPIYPDGRYVELEFAGHTVLESLKRSRLLQPFVSAVIEHDKVIPTERNVENDPLWHFQKGKHLAKSRPEQARYHFERSLEIEPSRHVAANLLGNLLALGDRSAAQDLLTRYRNHPEHPLPAPAIARARAFGLEA